MRQQSSCEHDGEIPRITSGNTSSSEGSRIVLKGAVVKNLAHEDHLDTATDARSVLFGMAPHFATSAILEPGPTHTARVVGQGEGPSGGKLSETTHTQGFYARTGKRILDVVLVVLSLPVALPLTLVLALALWIESGQPFYQQKRIGRNGRVFTIWKLRTMVRDADCMLEYLLRRNPELRAEWDATQKLKKDPRITPVGRFLRMSSLDEVPQLFNVLIGEMSLIGPRPMLPEQLPLYGATDAYCALRPGLSGPWQVSDRNNSSFSYRAVLDRKYLGTLSLSQDIAIIFRTIGVVLRRTGH